MGQGGTLLSDAAVIWHRLLREPQLQRSSTRGPSGRSLSLPRGGHVWSCERHVWSGGTHTRVVASSVEMQCSIHPHCTGTPTCQPNSLKEKQGARTCPGTERERTTRATPTHRACPLSRDRENPGHSDTRCLPSLPRDPGHTPGKQKSHRCHEA